MILPWNMQENDKHPLQAAIQRVESGLIPGIGVVIKGRPLPVVSLAERMEAYHVPGVSIAVINKGKVAWARGYGFADEEKEQRATPQTLFQAASVSKPVAAAAAGHRMNGRMIKGNWHTYPEMAAAGLWTTPTDLCRFGIHSSPWTQEGRGLSGRKGPLFRH
ncbi:MAG: beta-lactamase family protein [Candidatus Aminicenantes bacterium]|nr:beta-lactamase family protein [Candidatus Aminicenantes bacterium]